MQNRVSATIRIYLICLSLGCSAAFANRDTSLQPLLTPTEFISRAEELKLAQDPQWLRLLHYKSDLLWRLRSEVAGSNFFVSEEGKVDPAAELRATIQGFFDFKKRPLGGKQPDQTVRCQFPARYRWLDFKLGLTRALPMHPDCTEFSSFSKRLSPQSATVVFSSFHVSNPSSVFGHTLLRLNRAPRVHNPIDNAASITTKPQPTVAPRSELLDYGINFAAVPTTTNPIAYAFYGLIGVFPGSYTALPYYYKVREYADFESRDLWEYDLDLTPDEIERVVEHLWELGSTHFNYYYLSKNCSYQLLTLLEAAAPRLELTREIPWWVVPTDTIKALFKQKGLIQQVRFRPSIHTQFMSRVSRLDPQARASFRALWNAKSTDLSQIADKSQAAWIADAYMDRIDLNYPRQVLDKDPTIDSWKRKLLIERAKLPVDDAAPLSPQVEEAPHRSHGSSRMTAYAASNSLNGAALGFSVRFALHDGLDPGHGLPDSAEIDFARISFRGWSEGPGSIRVEDYALFGVGALLPIDEFHRDISWRFAITGRRTNDARCFGCVPLGIAGAVGAAMRPFSSRRLYTYALLDARVEASDSFYNDRVTFIGGPLLGFKWRLQDDFGVSLEAKWTRSLNAPAFTQVEVESIIRKTWSDRWLLESRGRWTSSERDVLIGAGHYF